MEYLKIWTSFAEIIEPLNDSERGRLFTAMLVYADCGELPEFKGNERYVWPIAKQAIDRARAESEKLAANGSKGGRPRKNQEKPNETKENQEKPNESHKDNNKEKDKDKDNKPPKSPEGFDAWWAVYPKHEGKQNAIKAFIKIKPDAALLDKMISSVKVWKNSQQWTKDNGQFIPMPATWLNGHRWEDEQPKVITLTPAQTYTQRQYTESDLEARITEL